ncbi:MAG: homoserine kinase [Candidatus Sumerlaeaceae bacterium]
MSRRVTVHVPATTANLGPGFDCLGMAVQMYNTIDMEDNGNSALSISLAGSCASDTIPVDEHNLVYRAAAKVFEVVGRRPDKLTIRLTLESPLARGLGSSASAITGGIVAANAMLGNTLSQPRLLSLMLGMEGHPDNIVPCLVGGLTASLAIDGRVTYIRRTPAPNVVCVLLVPGYELSTAKARQAIPKSVPLKDAVFNLSRIPFVLERLESGNLEGLAELMDDMLHQPYRKPLIRAYEEVSVQAMQHGAAAVCISGAGPTILAIADSGKSADVAAAMAGALDAIGVEGHAHVLKPDVQGTRVTIHE